jgi:hypothetical protein
MKQADKSKAIRKDWLEMSPDQRQQYFTDLEQPGLKQESIQVQKPAPPAAIQNPGDQKYNVDQEYAKHMGLDPTLVHSRNEIQSNFIRYAIKHKLINTDTMMDYDLTSDKFLASKFRQQKFPAKDVFKQLNASCIIKKSGDL